MAEKPQTTLEGRVWTFGRDVDTDLIIPARYLTMKTAQSWPSTDGRRRTRSFPARCSPGTSWWRRRTSAAARAASTRPSPSRAPACRRSSPRASPASSTATPSTPACPSWSRLRRRTAFSEGDRIRADLATGTIENLTRNETYQAEPLPAVHAGPGVRRRAAAVSEDEGATGIEKAMEHKIAVIPGDGTGPEVVARGPEGAGGSGRAGRLHLRP